MENQIIVALSGRKNAGKNTISQVIREYFAHIITKSNDMLNSFSWKKSIVEQKTMECSFADDLKEFCINVLGLEKYQCYGSEEEKNSPTKYKWDDVSSTFLRWKFGSDSSLKLPTLQKMSFEDLRTYYYSFKAINSSACLADDHKIGHMSGREIMQLFGTDLIRETFGNVWAESTIRRIKRNDKILNVITDNRFPNEVEVVLSQPNSYIIRLTRSPFGKKDSHPSECALDDFNWDRPKCYVFDNSNMSQEEQSLKILPVLDTIFGQYTEIQ